MATPEIRTLPDIVDHWAGRTPDRIALVAGDTQLSWADLSVRVNDLAGTFADSGDPHQPIAYFGHNTPEFWVTWFAANRARRPFVPLNWRLAVPEIVALLEDCDPCVVVTQEVLTETLRAAIEGSDRVIDLWPLKREYPWAPAWTRGSPGPISRRGCPARSARTSR